ncbi:MAG: MFS transporter, partial [Nitrososphaerota archaeon]
MSQDARRMALRFVLFIGIVSLFGDVTYEGARGVIGPYLGILGASAIVIGGLTGTAEFIGYALRIASGAITDKLKNPWIAIYLGYTLNLVAVPLLSIAGRWETAAVLVLLERIGKAIRTPGRDAMISEATSSIGRGMGFGIHEALDQIGAVAGPIFVSVAMYISGDYRIGFALLAIPAMISL